MDGLNFTENAFNILHVGKYARILYFFVQVYILFIICIL